MKSVQRDLQQQKLQATHIQKRVGQMIHCKCKYNFTVMIVVAQEPQNLMICSKTQLQLYIVSMGLD